MNATPPNVDEVLELPALLSEPIPKEWEDENGHLNIQYYMALYMRAARPMLDVIGVADVYDNKRRHGLFDLEHHLWYLSEIHAGETVSVHARLLDSNAKRFHGIMFLLNQTRGQLASAFEFVSSGADLVARRTSPFPNDVAQAIDSLVREHAKLEWEAQVCGVISV